MRADSHNDALAGWWLLLVIWLPLLNLCETKLEYFRCGIILWVSSAPHRGGLRGARDAGGGLTDVGIVFRGGFDKRRVQLLCKSLGIVVLDLPTKTRVRNGGRRAARAKRSGLCNGKVATGETHRFGRSILEPTITQGMEFMPQKLMILSYTMRTMSNDLRFVTE